MCLYGFAFVQNFGYSFIEFIQPNMEPKSYAHLSFQQLDKRMFFVLLRIVIHRIWLHLLYNIAIINFVWALTNIVHAAIYLVFGNKYLDKKNTLLTIFYSVILKVYLFSLLLVSFDFVIFNIKQ